MRRGAGLLALCLALVTTLLTACSGGDGDDPVRLRVLAGPDLAVLACRRELKDETGVDLRLDHRADAETKTPDSDRYDLAWLSSDRYLRLTDKNATRGWQRTPTMTSPVVIGLKPDVALELRAQVPGSRLTWADIADAAATGTVRFGMADPRHAGSGLAALVGVATAAAGTGAALRPEDVSCDRLRGFRSGQTLTADTGPALLTPTSITRTRPTPRPLRLTRPDDGRREQRGPVLSRVRTPPQGAARRRARRRSHLPRPLRRGRRRRTAARGGEDGRTDGGRRRLVPFRGLQGDPWLSTTHCGGAFGGRG
ncbi:hypothetical protein SVIOM74S_05048 [Streptomyces violarus]